MQTRLCKPRLYKKNIGYAIIGYCSKSVFPQTEASDEEGFLLGFNRIRFEFRDCTFWSPTLTCLNLPRLAVKFRIARFGSPYPDLPKLTYLV